MKGSKSRFSGWIEDTGHAAWMEIRKWTGQTKDKIDLDRLFRKQAVSLKRISANLLNLDATILGIFDRKGSTLTVRAGEKIEKGELFESEHVQYRIEAIRPEEILIPLNLGHKIQSMSCRVAELRQV